MSDRRFFLFPIATRAVTLIVALLTIHYQILPAATQTGFSGLLPFGSGANDLSGPTGDDAATFPLTLTVPFTFIGTEYTQIIVNTNGVLSFDNRFTSCCPTGNLAYSIPLIAPFWHDFDPRVGGTIYYRQTNAANQLNTVHQIFSSLDTGELSDFSPTHLFIATWDRVSQFSGSIEINNTFQVILATDRIRTASVFIYRDIRWGAGAQIGFGAGDGYTSLTLPEALTNETLNVDEYSNVGEPGVLVYRIDRAPLSGLFLFGGTTNDQVVPSGDDSSSKPIDLGASFNFFGREYRQIVVNSNGVLSFDGGFSRCCPPRNFPVFSSPLIAPFWHDFDSTIGGKISYRVTSSSIYQRIVHNLLVDHNTGYLTSFYPTHVFTATWSRVPQFNGNQQVNNTFQVFLATDSIQTVAIFIYHDIQWGESAQIGFNSGDGQTYFTLPEALSEETIRMHRYSNVGSPGVFVYPIDILPDQPHMITVDSREATSINLNWEPPFATVNPVLYYVIYIKNQNTTTMDLEMNEVIAVNTLTNATFFNVTGLLPGTTYELTVVAVSQGGDVVATSEARIRSNSVITTTGFTVPALVCDALVSSNGLVVVSWNYNHTGGLPLTQVLVWYDTLLEGSVNGNSKSVPISDVNATSVSLSNLQAGFEYVFTIIAENDIGDSSIGCGPVSHEIGRPTEPVFVDVQSGPNGGEITVKIQCQASGIDNIDSEVFGFVVTPVLDGVRGERVAHVSLDYQSGQVETLVISGLVEGESYTLVAMATNLFGNSQKVTSDAVIAGHSTTLTSSALIGGATGGGVFVVLIIIIVLTVTVILIAVSITRARRKAGSRAEINLMNRGRTEINMVATLEEEAVYEEPGPMIRHLPRIPHKDLDITCKLEDCPAYGAV